MSLFKKNIVFFLGIIFVCLFFHKVLISGLLPMPTDTIVGLYHPFRDFYIAEYPRGIPFENSLVTDPVRQQYPWRELSISIFKNFELPLWNPYNFAGYPLLANFQSAVFYPLNILMLVLPIGMGWSFLIISQPILAFIFMFLFLRNLRISNTGSFMGSVSFAFSGFFVSWLEWGNIVSTGLWLPLILLSIDKFFSNKKLQYLGTKSKWGLVFLFALVFAFLAGHLQTFFYLSVLSLAYFIFRLFEDDKKVKSLFTFSILLVIFFTLTVIQSIPTLQLVLLSARNLDQVSTNVEGWFIPWQNLVQFVAPDFFGNPATLNYWGVWNYGEFIGYIGLLPLILAMYALLFKRDKLILFFGITLLLALLFALPTIIAKTPFIFDVPFISTTQPTRLLYIVNFSLAVLAGVGFDHFLKSRVKILVPTLLIGSLIAIMWGYVLYNPIFPDYLRTTPDNVAVALNNLKLPTLTFAAIFFLIIIVVFGEKIIKNKMIGKVAIAILILIFMFDVFRFASKYTVFASSEYLYPTTNVISFLQRQEGQFRIMSTDSRILPPNFTSIYRLQSVDGYDPLYTTRYGELMAAIGRDLPDIDPPFGFNRIITPHNYHSNLINLLNVKYILSFTDIEKEGFMEVLSEGEVKIFHNQNALNRAFFVNETIAAENKNDAIEKLFEYQDRLGEIAIIENTGGEFNKKWAQGSVVVIEYNANKVVINTVNEEAGFLVLMDSYYPTWKAYVNGKMTDIYLSNYNFRGVVVPKGENEVIFTNSLF